MSTILIYTYIIVVYGVAANDICVGSAGAESDYPELRPIITAVGDMKEIILQSQSYELKTISIEPLAFEISNYLTDNECDEIIKVSKKVGLESSQTRQNSMYNEYRLFDVDDDNHLNLSEMRITLEQNHDVNLNDADIIEMYEILGLSVDDNHLLSKHELMRLNPSDIVGYIEGQLLENKPSKHSRLSEQAWLFYPDDYNAIITTIHHRLYDLFKYWSIPQYIVNNSYTLQVVHYGKNGKYNAHFDSSVKSSDSEECCFVQRKKGKSRDTPCKSCRFMTVLYYLNTVEKGGDTVFPLSNTYYKSKRFNAIEKYDSLRWRMSENNLPEVYCNDSVDNLKVKPQRGKALIWFNHIFDTESNWIGDVDFYSLHTGCGVIEGEKWIANHWILVNDVPLINTY